MAEETQIVKQKQPAFSVELTNNLNEVVEALPKNFNIPRFVQNGVALLNDNDQLKSFARQYGTAQIRMGMMKAAYLGLDFMNKEAYLIPYGSSLQFMKDYRGDTKLVRKYSLRPVLDIYAKIVRKGDELEEKIVDGRPSINFKPIPFNGEPIIGAFAVCLFKDGGMVYDVMSLEELEQARKVSKMSQGATWKNWTTEMYRKTVLHRICKHIQIDFETPEQRMFFEEDMKADFTPQPTVASVNTLLEGEY